MLIRWRYIDLYFFTVAMMLAWALVPLFRRMALRYGIVDHPNHRKPHQSPVPLLGGGAIFCAFSITVLLHSLLRPWLAGSAFAQDWIPNYYLSHATGAWQFTPRLVTVFLGALVIAAVGLLDDLFDLSIQMRFYVEILVSVIVVSVGVQPDIAFLPQPLVWILSVVWLIGITNSFNLLDGADGLAAGVAALSSLMLAWVMTWGGQPLNAVWLCALAGAAAGFLVYNFPPARIFMGSMGSMLLGYMVGTSVLISTTIPTGTNLLFALLIPILILGIPLYDTFSVIVIRIVQGRSIVLADQSHFVHRLMRLGFSVKQAVLFIYLLTLCSGITAVLLIHADAVTGFVLLGQALLFFAVIIVLERVMFGRESGALRRSRRTGED